MNSTKSLTLTAMLVAIGTLTSHLFYIPIGVAKVFPTQHLINVFSAVLLGPYYAVIQAFTVSLLRNFMGTGSIFAFPGSIFGALLAAFFYKKTGRLWAAFSGEVFGTGLLGALATYPIATLFMGKEAALFGFVPAFFLSSITGAMIAFAILTVLFKNTAVKSRIDSQSLIHK
ncbi:energy coupling factor transporter S component ThiW [Mesobacillus foraminis]|uniref:energy coupling factor transporter S component ThiW n=1 Tax=Mesobacillus foraminis TaxID=279826 RepID=UPI001BE93710|nr:energy coupling factor transporter S component ThiW [Mesobacillus foraminis]MBT2755111.1 energy coupling factor transporter S component ThiW [Mesobacillus foraminis]